jgi:uncharacterized membrane protein
LGYHSPGRELTVKRSLTPAIIGLLAVLIALVAVLTLLVRVPTPARGYVNLSDAAITFAGLAFGPWVGAIAGGAGTAIADMLGGFAPYAPISLVAHGVQGFLIGLIGGGRRDLPRIIVAWLAGAIAMVTGYLLGGALYVGLPTALLEVPLNVMQTVVGAIVGIPLVFAVRKAYPPVDRLGQRTKWTE